MRLTVKQIENAIIKPKEYFIHDGQGLYIRIRPSGAKSWVFAYILPTTTKIIRMTLGSIKDMSLKEAREQLPDLLKQVKAGIDPRTTKATTIASNVAHLTTQKLFDLWITFLKNSTDKDRKQIQHHEGRWNLYFKKSFGNILAKDVTRAHLAPCIEAIINKNRLNQALKAMNTLNMLFDYGVSRHHIDVNVARHLKPKDFDLKPAISRNRVLSFDEIVLFWNQLNTLENTHDGIIRSSLCKLLILTGARRGEMAKMCWEDVDLEKGIWTIPAECTKNNQRHTIYLGKTSIEILLRIKDLQNSSEYVFVCRGMFKSIHPDSLTTRIGEFRKKPELACMKHFTIHDLRRTAATHWAEDIKVLPHIIEKMLNHQPQNKLIAVYQRAEYSEEQRKVWLTWDNMIRKLICGSNLLVESYY